MNGLENITGKILSEAQDFVDEIKKQSDRKVEQILLDYKSQADALRAEYSENAKTEAEQIMTRAKGQAALNERNELLRRKRDIIDEVFSKACDLIVSQPKDVYVEMLADLVARYQTGPAVIILNEHDAKEFGSDLLKKIVVNKIRGIDLSMIKISKEHGSFKGGLILRQGDIDTNCTVEVLCEGMRHDLEAEVVRRLRF